MNKKLLLFLILIVFNVQEVFPQQEPQYTQYIYNTTTINPAYAGNRGVTSVFGLHRSQWVGLEGAPRTSVFSLNVPFNDSNVGLAATFSSDKVGPADESGVSFDVSYTIPMNDDYNLSFGLKGTLSSLNVDFRKLHIQNSTDVFYQSNIDDKFIPNIGAGLYLFSDRLFTGFSVPSILETSYYDDNDPYVEAKKRITMYFMGGYVFDINRDLKFKPTFISKAVKGSPLQLDLTANFLIDEKLVLGAAWRWSAAVSGMAGFQLTNNWFIGYSYDADTTRLANYNSGSHEIFLRYDFVSTKRRVSNPHRLKCFCAE